MKKITFSFLLLTLTVTTFAQLPICPSYFRRNNGNGQCGQGQLKVYFTNCPAIPPVIDSIYNEGLKLDITLSVPDPSKCASLGYISYCILSGNIAQATSTWQIFFHYPNLPTYSCNVPEGGSLPVKYLSFDAIVVDNLTTIKWVTTQEVNNSHFEVERSFNNSSYSIVGLVLGGVAINGTDKRYEFKDNSLELKANQVAYYRLKQFDIDGNFTYSKIIAVKLQPRTDVSIEVSPNPFVETVNLRFNALVNGNAQIRIVNMTGQTMLSRQSIISKGYNNIQIDGLSRLASGIYIAQLVMNGVVIDNQRVVKANSN